MKRPSVVADILNPEPEVVPIRDNVTMRNTEQDSAEMSDVVRTSIYISRAAHERLREIAFTKRQRVHGLIVEGIDMVLSKHGHSETARAKIGFASRKR
jgi:hypothetical protein